MTTILAKGKYRAPTHKRNYRYVSSMGVMPDPPKSNEKDITSSNHEFDLMRDVNTIIYYTCHISFF